MFKFRATVFTVLVTLVHQGVSLSRHSLWRAQIRNPDHRSAVRWSAILPTCPVGGATQASGLRYSRPGGLRHGSYWVRSTPAFRVSDFGFASHLGFRRSDFPVGCDSNWRSVVAQVSKPAVSPTSKSAEPTQWEAAAGLETRDTVPPWP